MLRSKKTILSICLSCRDGLEDIYMTRGGKRFADFFLDRIKNKKYSELKIRGIRCMSQCKRPCIISLSSEKSFTYIFGDIKPSKKEYFDQLLSLINLYNSSQEGFMKRRDRPELFKSNILGRIPPIVSNSSIVTDLYKG